MNAFGFLFFCVPLVTTANTALAADTNEDFSKLRPPHDLLPPSYWSQHGALMIIAALLVLAALIFGIIFIRQKISPPVPPELRARTTLAALQGKPEDAALVAKVSRALKEYVVFAFGLPPGELTTTELRQSLGARPGAKPALAAGVGDFLHQCDVRKFSPAPSTQSTPSTPHTGVVNTALNWVDQIEAHRQQALNPVPAPPQIVS